MDKKDSFTIGVLIGALIGAAVVINNSPKIQEKIKEGLKEFRKKNWESKLPRDKAYKKYMKRSKK